MFKSVLAPVASIDVQAVRLSASEEKQAGVRVASRGAAGRGVSRLGVAGLLAAVSLVCATGLLEQSLHAQGVVVTPPINTFVGNGTAGFMGDNGPATAAEIDNPEGLAFDGKGNIYLSDYFNNRIRIVSPSGVISTFAGTGTQCPNPTAATGACGDGGAASAATFYNPTQMQFDNSGNLYIADYSDNRIRKITATNGVITGASIITTVAGNGNAAETGNGGQATAAGLYLPHGLAIDASGNIYILDQIGCTVRKVTAATGVISLFAGNGTCGYAGDGGQANAAGVKISQGVDIALDASNNLYIADRSNNVVRKVTASTNVISTYAGINGSTCTPATGNCGDGGAATSANLTGPAGLGFDAVGNLIIADADGARVRKITTSTGVISTIAGTGTACNASGTASGACGDGGQATRATLSFPINVTPNAAGNIFFTDQYANRVRYLSPPPIFQATPVGSASASLNILVTTTGTANTIISSISVPNDPSGVPQFTVGTVSGCVIGGTTGNPTGTLCTIPVTFTPSYPGVQSEPLIIVTNGGTLQVPLVATGTAPQAILLPGVLSTVVNSAGAAGTEGQGNGGAATAAGLNLPRDISFDYAGNLYIGDVGNGGGTTNTAEIRKVTASTGIISQFAGGGNSTYSSTSSGVAATSVGFNYATGVIFDAAGNAYIPDFFHNVVARVDAVTGNIKVYAGQYGVVGNTGDGGAATSATLSGPAALAIDPLTGNLYIVDPSNSNVREVNAATGVISTVVGVSGSTARCATTTAACGDGGQATAAQLNQPNGIAIDASGNIYIADSYDNRIRRVNRATGVISPVAGTGTAGYTGDNGAATSATLTNPFQIALDPAGDLFIADTGNNAVRAVIASTQTIITVAGKTGNNTACTANPGSSCGDGGPSNVSALNAPTGVALDAFGDVYIAESTGNRVRKVTINPAQLNYPTEPIGTSGGNQSEALLNIGNATLTYTTPVSPDTDAKVTTTGPTAVASNAFTQTGTTTCGPITASSTTGTTLASGTTCNFVVNFTPDTAVGNYTGTLVETDNSLNNTASTQTVNLTGVGTQVAPTVTLISSVNPSYVGQSTTLTATVSGPGVPPTGSVAFTYTTTAAPTTPITITGSPVTVTTTAGVTTAVLSTASLPLGTDSVTATYNGDTNYSTVASSVLAQAVIQATNTGDTVTAAQPTITQGTADQLTFAIPVVTGAGAPAGSVAFSSGGVTFATATWPTNATPTTCPSGSGSCYVLSPASAPTNIPAGTPTTITATFTPTSASGYAAQATAPTTNVNVLLADTITVSSPAANPSAATYSNGGTVAITAASTSGQPITYTSTTPGICSVSSTGVVTTLSTGQCIVSLTQPAAGNYAAATPVSQTIQIGAGTDTINFPALPNTVFGATAPVPAATSTSGQPVTYSSTSPASICSVTSAGAITDAGVGQCSITASQPAAGNYAQATPVTNTFQITAAPDTITVSSPAANPSAATYSNGGTVAITAASTSGQPITYTSTTPGICSVSSTGVVTTLSTGQCIVSLTQPAAGNYAAATPVSQTIQIGAGTDTINFPALPNTVFGATAPVPAATSTSGQPVTYSSTSPASICSVTSAGAITDAGVGQCSITASQPAAGNYAQATPVTNTFQITAAPDTITVSSPAANPSAATYSNGGTVAITAASTSGQPITYTSTTPGICSVSSTGVVTTLSTGQCIVSLTQPAAGNYAAATPVSQTIQIGAGTDTINFPALPNTVFGATAPVPAATSTSGQPVTYSSTSPASVCSVTSAGAITDAGVGQCSITASQPAAGNYAQATPVTNTFQITAAPDAITVSSPAANPSAATYSNGGTVAITAASTSGQPITYTSTTPGICSVSSTGVVTTLSTGQCIVSLTQPAAGNYAAATPVSQTIQIGAGTDTINFPALPNTVFGATAPVPAATSTSGQPVTYSSTSPASVCSVTSAGAITDAGVGQCSITASQPAAGNYAQATPVTNTFQITAAPDAITVSSPAANPSAATYSNGGTVAITAASTSGQPITYTSTTPGICSVSSTGVVTTLSTGQCIVSLTQPAAGNYAAATPVSQTIQIGAGTDTINFPALPNTVFGATAPVPAATSTSGQPVTYSSTSPASVCSVTSAGAITDAGVGQCSITASQPAAGNYAQATPVTNTFQITAAPDTITVSSPAANPSAATYSNGGTVAITAASTSGQPITYTSTTPGICSVSSTGVVTTLSTGQCIVSLTQPAAGNYAAATPVSQTIQIGAGTDTINFPALPNTVFGATAPVPAATSTSGQPVTYSSTSPASVCSVTSAGAITDAGVGQCSITASQPAAGNYAQATPVTNTFQITAAPDAITVSSPAANPSAATYSNGGTVAITAASTSGQPITYTSTTPGICSVSSTGVVTTLSTGQCIVSLTQPAAGNYAAATPVSQTIQIGAGTDTINFPALPNTVFGATAPVPAATSTSGQPVTYSSTSPASVCSVTSAGAITDAGVGQCSITASQPAAGNYAQATPVTNTFQITAAPDAITVSSPAANPSAATYSNGGTVAITAASTSGQPITYTSTTPGICSVSSTGVVTTLSTGQCIVSLTQPAAGNYAAATPVSQTIQIGAGTDTINFPALPNTVFGATAPVPAATSTSGQPVTYSSTSPASVCSVTSAGAITDAGVGQCSITASQPAAGNYAQATPVTNTFQITAAPDTITVSSPAANPSAATYSNGGTVAITAASTSGQPITYTSTTPGICSVSSTGVVTTLSTGQCIVSLTQPAAGNYAAATPVSQTIQIGAGTDTINFPALPNTVFGATAPVPAATSTSGQPVTYSSTSPASVCSVTSAGAITDAGVGQCSITASQPAAGNYAQATPVTNTFQITAAPDAITVSSPAANPSAATYSNGGTVAITAASTSGQPITYTSTTPGICSVSSTGVVTTLSTGQCIVSLTQPAAGNYAAATPVSQTIQIGAGTDTINFPALPNTVFGATAPVPAATSTSGQPVTYSSTSPASVCSVTSAGAITDAGVGQCSITASQPAAGNYAQATPVTNTFQITPLADVITVPPTVPTTTTVGGTPVSIGATTTSGVTPAYTSTTPTVCSVSASGVVTALTSGTCSVTVSQAAAGNYAAATPQTVTFQIAGQADVITFPPLANTQYGATAPVPLATSTSGQPITYSSSTPAICTVTASGVISDLAVGQCSIIASQPASSTYAAATPVQQSFNITPLADIITVPPTVPTSASPGATVSIGATTTSGVTPIYSSTTPNVCSVSATGVVTLSAGGTCTITVSQPAMGAYAAAVTQTVTITAINSYDFSITTQAPLSQTVVPGNSVVYTYALAPIGGQYPGAVVTYTVTGLPPGATYKINPASGTVTSTGGPQTLQLTILTAQETATNRVRQSAPWTLALLLPLFLLRKTRRKFAQVATLLLLLGVSTFAITGCALPNGFFGQGVMNYSITVTATSGAISHSAAPVNLQVQ